MFGHKMTFTYFFNQSLKYENCVSSKSNCYKVTGNFFAIQHTEIQVADQDTFVQLYCKFL